MPSIRAIAKIACCLLAVGGLFVQTARAQDISGAAAPAPDPAYNNTGLKDGATIENDFADIAFGRNPLTMPETTARTALAANRFYIGLEAGLSISGDLDVSQSFVNHPTRCDPFLYAPGAAPTDGECAAGQLSMVEGIFAPGAGFAGSAALGYTLGNGLRLEVEYLHRRQGSDDRRIPLGSDSDGDVLAQKGSEWDANDPPSERIYDWSTHHVFFNAWYDLRTGSRFTPYIGGGVGMASTTMNYSGRFLRRSDLGPEPWQVAAAGTLSHIEPELENTGLGFQVAGGIEYALRDNVSIGAKVRWIRSGGFDDNGKLWTQIRDHDPVRSDGVTPFTSDFNVGDMQSWVMTVGLRYYL